MKIILLFISIVILATAGCIVPENRDRGEYRDHDDHHDRSEHHDAPHDPGVDVHIRAE
jgi:hypothetical protein